MRIVRDRYGVPAITGASDSDAWWGAGYAVAQDRLFQLELFRRATSGRLAEILGDTYLDDDLIARRDYYTDAELDAMIARIPPQLRQRAEAYRDGVNAWSAKVRSRPDAAAGRVRRARRDSAHLDAARHRPGRRLPGPHGARPATAARSRTRAPCKSWARRASTSCCRCAPRARAHGPGVATAPSPPSPGARASRRGRVRALGGWLRGVTLPGPQPQPRPASGRRTRLAVIPRGGSYMWAIGRPAEEGAVVQAAQGRQAAVRTVYRRPKGEGNAYLFNGPQLGYSIPELFVEFELHSPAQNMRGVTAAGIPVMGIGHNGHLAWGFTSGLSDEDDLYAETLTGAETYRYKGASRPMDCRNERFDFRAPVTDLPDLIGSRPAGCRARAPSASAAPSTARSRSAPAARPTPAATPSGAASWRRWSGLSAAERRARPCARPTPRCRT